MARQLFEYYNPADAGIIVESSNDGKDLCMSGLFIQGNQDDFVPQDQVFKLVEKLRAQRGIEIDYNIIEGANHFFTGKEKELEQSIRAYIDAAPQLLPPEEDDIEEDDGEEEDVEMDFDDILDAMDSE